MKSDIVIKVENLSKQYRLGTINYGTLYQDLQSWWAKIRGKDDPNAPIIHPSSEIAARMSNEAFLALNDVSFEVKQGEIIGIIGRNGAGKSTLLKILSRVTAPTRGTVKIRGRVASLLEVGTGFHPELTGRENIYLNGAILGMRKKEIDHKFDEIVDFSGVEKFIDTPVKRYSSGMYVRLAFAVAAHLDPEILLVDEVLSVGDAAFQKKCLVRMGEAAEGGKTVLFVSHNMSAVAALCSRAYWLDSGRIAMSGVTGVVVHEYLKSIQMRDGALLLKDRHDRDGTGAVRATEVAIEDLHGKRLQFAKAGEGIRFVISYLAGFEGNLDEVVAHLTILDSQNHRIFCCMSDVAGSELRNLPIMGQIVCILQELPLVPGRYDLHLSLHANRLLADKIYFVASFQVVGGDFFGTGRLPPEYVGSIMVRHTWCVEDVKFSIA